MIPLPWLGAGAAGLALAGVIAVQTVNVTTARGARDTARAELATAQTSTAATQAALDTERISTRVAVDGAARCAAENANLSNRHQAALNGCNAEAARLRRVLAKSQTDDALLERSGELFK